MTNVPGFIPKPYPIVIFPGTFVIILEKAAVDFFHIMEIFPTNHVFDFLVSASSTQKMKCWESPETRFPKL